MKVDTLFILNSFTAKLNLIFKLGIIALLLSTKLQAQDLGFIVEEANKVYESKNFAAAAEKYAEALKADSSNINTRYKLAFSLNYLGRGLEALPHLQTVTESATSQAIKVSCFGLMGNIYDQTGFPGKAIPNYLSGIRIDSTDYSLHYGLGLAYFRDKRFVKAEESALNSIKLNPKHAPSVRLYALVTFHQNKRAPAFLALCNFLWMEPLGQFAIEALNNMQSIIKGGVLKTGTATKPPGNEKTIMLNKAITGAVTKVGAQNLRDKSTLFREQLKAIFNSVGEATNQTDEAYFRDLSNLYYKLSQINHLSTFAYYISQSTDKNSAAWVAAHTAEVKELKKWRESGE